MKDFDLVLTARQTEKESPLIRSADTYRACISERAGLTITLTLTTTSPTRPYSSHKTPNSQYLSIARVCLTVRGMIGLSGEKSGLCEGNEMHLIKY